MYKNIKETILQKNDKESLKKLGWIYHLKRGSMNEIDIRAVIND
jgi:carbonic anhydrase